MKSNLSQKFQFAFLAQNQAQKEILVNENFNRLDCLLNNGIISRSKDTPPAQPKYGDLYLIPKDPKGAWRTFAGHLAFFTDTWNCIMPKSGMIFAVLDEDLLIFMTSSNIWNELKPSNDTP